MDRIYVGAQRWRSLAREGETDQTEKNLIPKCAPLSQTRNGVVLLSAAYLSSYARNMTSNKLNIMTLYTVTKNNIAKLIIYRVAAYIIPWYKN